MENIDINNSKVIVADKPNIDPKIETVYFKIDETEKHNPKMIHITEKQYFDNIMHIKEVATGYFNNYCLLVTKGTKILCIYPSDLLKKLKNIK